MALSNIVASCGTAKNRSISDPLIWCLFGIVAMALPSIRVRFWRRCTCRSSSNFEWCRTLELISVEDKKRLRALENNSGIIFCRLCSEPSLSILWLRVLEGEMEGEMKSWYEYGLKGMALFPRKVCYLECIRKNTDMLKKLSRVKAKLF